jgi:hypothetical protein
VQPGIKASNRKYQYNVFIFKKKENADLELWPILENNISLLFQDPEILEQLPPLVPPSRADLPGRADPPSRADLPGRAADPAGRTDPPSRDTTFSPILEPFIPQQPPVCSFS